MRYFDASALVKRYVKERGTADVERWLKNDTPATSRLSEVEVASAIARRCREGAISPSDRDRALAMLHRDVAAMLIVELSPDVAESATRLVVARGLRANDAIQLAGCQVLDRSLEQDVVFVAFDERLNAAARAEGLTTV
jgi:predicted nucleic acid-binding protein